MQSKYTAKDLKSSLDVKWCAGCGDYGILNSIQKALPELGIEQEDIAIISGIGCSSRLPYYMETYGLHSIHGRASAIATGVKVANPSLSVWQIGGDGDTLAIGGNHFIHAIRRNIDINIVIFNNEIYGLTKGQYSPTTKKGKLTKTSPFGTIEEPFNPGALAIGCSGRFFARTLDNNSKHASGIFVKAGLHKGTSVVEVLQNCVIFNDGTFSAITDKSVKDERQLFLEHGKPMIWGKEKKKGLVLKDNNLEVVVVGENGVTESDILVHNEKEKNPWLHTMLVSMKAPDFPVAFGIIRSIDDDTYDDLLTKQNNSVKEDSVFTCVDDLLNSGDAWSVD